MSTPALPAGRGDDRRVRLYARGEWDKPVYDSTLSDMHPDDYLLYGPHTELGVVIDLGNPSRFRWSGIWTQKSRRRIERHDNREYLRYLTWPTNPYLEPQTPQQIWEGYQPA